MPRERTFIMLKPDAVQRGLIGQIMQRFEKKGFKLVAMKLTAPGRAHMEAHYADLKSKKFFPSLVDYMTSGPVCAMIWEGDNAVATGRVMLGATRPQDSLPGTIRGDMCVDVGRNIIHGSDAVESANHEIALWFSENELCQWASHSAEQIYEMPEPNAAPKEEKKDAAAAAELALSAEEAARIQKESDENEACIAARIKAEAKIKRNEDEVKARQAAAAKMLEETMAQKTGTLAIKVERADCSVMIKKPIFMRIEGTRETFSFQTETLAKTKKPVWNAEFNIPIADFQNPVKFTVAVQEEGDAKPEIIGDGTFRPMVFTTGAPPNFPFTNPATKRIGGKAFMTATWNAGQ